MELKEDILKAFEEVGNEIKEDLWKPEDKAYLQARAADLAGLNEKAKKATNPNKKKAYEAAARDTLQGVKMLAMIRAEVAGAHLLEQIGKVFMEKVLPVLIKLIPVIIAAL